MKWYMVVRVGTNRSTHLLAADPFAAINTVTGRTPKKKEAYQPCDTVVYWENRDGVYEWITVEIGETPDSDQTPGMVFPLWYDTEGESYASYTKEAL